MKAVILSAGLGTRIQKSFPNTPKVMLPIAGKPLLEHNIINLKKYGFNQIFINLHYLPKKVKNYFGDGKNFGIKIVYSLEPELFGTAGALVNFKKYLTETFVVIYGDIFMTLNFEKMLSFHKEKKSQGTLLIHETDHPNDSDLVAIDRNNQIYKFYISPHKGLVKSTNLSSAGAYILEPTVLKFLPKKLPSDFVEDFFPKLLKKKIKMFGYISSEFAKDVGTPQRYEETKRIIQLLK